MCMTSLMLMRLEELEQEEADDDFEMDGKALSPEEQQALAEIRKKKSLLIQHHRIKKSTAESRPVVPRKFDKDKYFIIGRMGRQLSALGPDPCELLFHFNFSLSFYLYHTFGFFCMLIYIMKVAFLIDIISKNVLCLITI